jgi:hypothetical protein
MGGSQAPRCDARLAAPSQQVVPAMDGLLQIIIVVVIVLFVLGYFGRGRFRR